MRLGEHPARNKDGGPLLPDHGAIFEDGGRMVAYVTPAKVVLFIVPDADEPSAMELVEDCTGSVTVQPLDDIETPSEVDPDDY